MPEIDTGFAGKCDRTEATFCWQQLFVVACSFFAHLIIPDLYVWVSWLPITAPKLSTAKRARGIGNVPEYQYCQIISINSRNRRNVNLKRATSPDNAEQIAEKRGEIRSLTIHHSNRPRAGVRVKYRNPSVAPTNSDKFDFNAFAGDLGKIVTPSNDYKTHST